MAVYTVMFISDAYRTKVWTNHERRSAQARAITESSEYILPAFFDEGIEVPGLLKTTGHISLKDRSPEQLASIIVQKLRKSGTKLPNQFSYSESAKADADFPLTKGRVVSALIRDMKSHTWPVQRPAVEKLLELDFSKVTPDEAFVLGRNLYQCACGSERKARAVLANIREELATIADARTIDLANGMFFEVYFDANGEFRGRKLKTGCLPHLLSLQGAKIFAPTIAFIRRALDPYRLSLVFLPNTEPENVLVELSVRRTDPPIVRTLKMGGRSLLSIHPSTEDITGPFWRLSYQSFTLKDLTSQLLEEFGIPSTQLTIKCNPKLEPRIKLRLPEGAEVTWPASA